MNNEICHMTTVEHHITTMNTMLNRHTYTFGQVEYAKILKNFTKCVHPIPNHPIYILVKYCGIKHANFEVK